jgi:hypothetical protein
MSNRSALSIVLTSTSGFTAWSSNPKGPGDCPQSVAQRLLGHAVGAAAASPSHLRRRRQQEAADGGPQLPRDERILQQTARVRA